MMIGLRCNQQLRRAAVRCTGGTPAIPLVSERCHHGAGDGI